MARKPTLQRLPGARLPGEGRAAARAAAPSKWIPASAKASEARDQLLLLDGHKRARGAAVLLIVALILLVARAGWMMSLPHEKIEARARQQFMVATERRGERGDILDRNGRILATTVQLPVLYGNPFRTPKDVLEAWLPDVAALTGKSVETLRLQMTTDDVKKVQEVRLSGTLEPAVAAAFQEKWATFVGDLRKDKTKAQPLHRWFWVEHESLRVYPGRELAAPLVGFVDSLETGSAGLEKVLDRELRGSSYRVLVEQDRRGYSVGVGLEESRTARDGRSVRLTLDASVQAATEAALLKAVEASRPEAAMAVVMEVRTGAILAIANLPAGNPNDLKARGVEKGELFKNHAVLDQIEPGSVMKPFVIAAAMNEGITRPEERIDCMMGRWAIGDKVIKDDHEKGVITLTQVLKYSSNIGTAVIGMRLGPERLVKYLKDFGFGRRSGLGFPGESPGALRNPQQARPIEIATTSFGQGMTASPVQLAAAMSTLGNDGMRMHPYLVDGTVEAGVLTRNAPREDRQAVSPEVARTTLAMMETVLDTGGTGTKARVPGYRVAGKTGTAQKVENGVYSATKRIGSFVGLLPADRPEIAIAVSIDTPTVGSKYGGLVAGPVFSEVGAFVMRYYGIPESTPATEPVPGDVVDPKDADAAPTPAPKPPAPKAAPAPAPARPPLVLRPQDGAWRMPDLTGRSLREATQLFERAGVRVRATGTGTLAQQVPAAGEALTPDTSVELTFR